MDHYLEALGARSVDKVAFGTPNRPSQEPAVGTCLTALTEEAGLQRPRWPDGRRLFVSSEFLPSQGNDLVDQDRTNGATHERRPDPHRDSRSEPLLFNARPEPHPQRPRAGAVPARHQRGERIADRLADAGADDEDRLRQHAAVPLPHGRGRHGLGPAPEPRQERRQRRHLAPARLDPARRPPPRGGLRWAASAYSP